jgi:hypothetical protein
VFFLAGRGFGSFIGGFLISDIGARETFRVMGYMAAVGGCIYGILHAFWLRHKVLTDPNQQTDAEQPGKNYNIKICIIPFYCFAQIIY